MTQRQGMTRPGTTKAAGRAAREHAERPAPGWPTLVLRVAGSGLLIATAVIHLDLYLTGYRTIPVIGWLFLLQVIAAFGLGLAVLAIPSRLVTAGRLAAAGLAVVALVLFGLAVAGANSAAPAVTGLKTATIGGTTVLTNAKGFTLYSFAPDTAAASKCYGSCAAYWPR